MIPKLIPAKDRALKNIKERSSAFGRLRHTRWNSVVADTNDRKMYEGDIIDLYQTVNGCNLFIIKWHKLGWTVEYCCKMTNPRLYEYDINDLFAPCEYSGEVDYKVIGDIHKNPELLK